MKTRRMYLYGTLLALAVGGCGDDSTPPIATKVPPATTNPVETKPADVKTQPNSDPPKPPLVKGRSEMALGNAGRNPTTVPSAEAVPAFQPLLNARAGQWAMYSALSSQGLRYEVAEINGSTLRTRVLAYDRNKLLGQPAFREDNRDVDLLAIQAAVHKAERKATRTRIEAMGKTWDAWLYEDRWIDEGIHYVRRSWVNDAVPVFGLLRMELHGDEALEAKMELTDFGPRASTP